MRMEAFIKIVWLFYLYSFMGWLWETVYCSLKERHFVYRGFLMGPITPIYGFGILGVLYFIEPLQNNIVLLYVLAAVLVTVLEYVTSFALEKLFHATWWDYKEVPFNINGRVALPVSVFWGFCCVLIVRVVHPRMLLVEGWLSSHFGVVLPVILLAVTLADLIYTVTNLASFQRVTAELSDIIETSQQEFVEKYEERKEELDETLDGARERLAVRVDALQEKFKALQEATELAKEEKEAKEQTWLEYLYAHEELQKRLPKINFNQRRIFKNFSHLDFEKRHNTKDLRELIEQIRKHR